MAQSVDFTLLSGIAAGLGMGAVRGRENCPEVSHFPCLTVAPKDGGGCLIYLHPGFVERESALLTAAELEAELSRHAIGYEARGELYSGGTRFFAYSVSGEGDAPTGRRGAMEGKPKSMHQVRRSRRGVEHAATAREAYEARKKIRVRGPRKR